MLCSLNEGEVEVADERVGDLVVVDLDILLLGLPGSLDSRLALG